MIIKNTKNELQRNFWTLGSNLLIIAFSHQLCYLGELTSVNSCHLIFNEAQLARAIYKNRSSLSNGLPLLYINLRVKSRLEYLGTCGIKYSNNCMTSTSPYQTVKTWRQVVDEVRLF